MIFFDVTKTGAAGHRSGLMRVSTRLRDALGSSATEITWNSAQRAFDPPALDGARDSDWFLTAELFSEEERPGFTTFLETRRCRAAAIFHDAIPLQHPHITWPQSVARHPAYLKLLARFDRVWAVSQTSRNDLLGFWRWQGIERPPPVEVLALGADFNASPRATRPTAHTAPSSLPRLLCVGIIEPRKNQAFLLDVCDALWSEGLAFELHLVGRVNPHFGKPIVQRIEMLRRRHRDRLHFHGAIPDESMAQLYASAQATLFPTIAEGCGLPLLESLWRGVPCVCSDLPVLRENADGGGCLAVAPQDLEAWKLTLRRVLSDTALHAQLVREATTRALPTWADTAQILTHALR